MAQATTEAKRQVELTRAALASDLDRLERKVKAELDWKARLRRDGARIAVIAGAMVLLVGGSIVLRRTLKSDDDDQVSERARGAVKGLRRGARRRLDDGGDDDGDVSKQIKQLREEVEKLRKGEPDEPLWLKAVMRIGAAGAAAAGTMAARQVLQRSAATAAEGTHPLPPVPA